jgi:ATP-dependent protease ClpP protease subunit/phage head maturation protease
MTTTTMPRRPDAAALRRRAADAARHERGDIAYRMFRSAAPGVGAARTVPTPAALTELRASQTERNGKPMFYTEGYFTRYERGYPMWDIYGEYTETVRRGAGARTLASNPDVAFLINHKGMTTARTKARSREATLILTERPEGGWHQAWHNPTRNDVSDMISAIGDELIDEMSFAFMIADDGAWWNEDFTAFDITAYDINRGDVSAVNYGASPHTDIAGRAGEVLNQLEYLPEGAQREALARLERRGLVERDVVDLDASRAIPRGPSGGPGGAERMASIVARNRERLLDHCAAVGLNVGAEVADMVGNLPWYEIRNAAGDDPGSSPRGDDEPTVFIFGEIGGSMGVSAKRFVADLEEIDAPQITLRINSPGGSVFDALAIHSALIHHRAHIRVFVDGLAASAASLIAMGGDEIVMMPGSQMMIHDASAMDDGNPAEKARMATFLDRQSQNIADLYARRAGGAADEWRALMRAETWAFAVEAVALGLADRTFDEPRGDVTAEQAAELTDAPAEVEARMRRSHDLSRFPYRYRGRGDAPTPPGMDGRMHRHARPGTGSVTFEIEDVTLDSVRAAFNGDGRKGVPAEDQPPVEVQPAPVNATHDQRRGRSIAYIEAQLDADMI